MISAALARAVGDVGRRGSHRVVRRPRRRRDRAAGLPVDHHRQPDAARHLREHRHDLVAYVGDPCVDGARITVDRRGACEHRSLPSPERRPGGAAAPATLLRCRAPARRASAGHEATGPATVWFAENACLLNQRSQRAGRAMSGCRAAPLIDDRERRQRHRPPGVARGGQPHHGGADHQHLGDRARDRAAVPRLRGGEEEPDDDPGQDGHHRERPAAGVGAPDGQRGHHEQLVDEHQRQHGPAEGRGTVTARS